MQRGHMEYRPTKAGKWRAYLVEQQAIMAWRGANYKATVVRDTDDKIVERKSEEALRAFLETQQWFWVSYRGEPAATAGERVREVWERMRDAHGTAFLESLLAVWCVTIW